MRITGKQNPHNKLAVKQEYLQNTLSQTGNQDYGFYVHTLLFNMKTTYGLSFTGSMLLGYYIAYSDMYMCHIRVLFQFDGNNISTWKVPYSYCILSKIMFHYQKQNSCKIFMVK